MAHNALQMEMPASSAVDHHPLPPLQTSPSDLTQSTFADASASDAAPDSTGSSTSTATSIYSYSASESASQPQSLSLSLSLPASQQSQESQSQSQSQSQYLPKMPAESAIPTSKPAQSDSVARRDDASATPSARTTTRTPPRGSPSTTTRSRSVTLDTPIQFSHGQKRTAAGELKSSVSPAQFQTPRNHHHLPAASGRHSRTTSTDSNADRIAEVSAQLRAKLSYAAARVESQRQLRSSPESTQGAGHWPYSPTSPAHSSSRPRQSLSFSHPEPRGPEQEEAGVAPVAETRNISLMPNGQNNSGVPAKLDMSQIPKLAPPADIVARNGASAPRRRPNPNLSHNDDRNNDATFKSPDKPSLSQQSSNSSSQTNFLTRDTPPPLPPPAAGQRTPSQNALMEQDAIETLLFMSSPENSGYRANSQQPAQPSNLNAVSSATMLPPTQHNQPIVHPGAGLRNHGEEVNYPDNGASDHLTKNAPSAPTYNNGAVPRGGPQRHPRDEIDQILDEMPDSDSDMEDGWLSRLAGQSQSQPQEQPQISTQAVGDASDTINSGSQQNRLWTSFP